MTELTQERIMLAGFRLLCKDTADGRFLIRYRDRELFEEYGNDRWRTFASFPTKEERDRYFERLLHDDVWTVEVSFPEPKRSRKFASADRDSGLPTPPYKLQV